MKKLNDFVVEARMSKKAQDEWKEENDVTLKDVKGKSEDANGTGGKWAVEAPTEDDILEKINPKELHINAKRIYNKIEHDEPFFVQGEAGWGKTSIITDIAHKLGRNVITVYLDKCEAVDLAGLPVPKESKRGADYVSSVMPGWATVMYDNPDKKYLLFFDEMNQAQPDVMNALMPIVLKNVVCGYQFKNFIVGGAGNFVEENSAVNDLSEPLKRRFGNIIRWVSGDWDAAFAHLHKKWDDTLGKQFVDKVFGYASLFHAPRDIDNFVFKYFAKEIELVKGGRESYLDSDDLYDWYSVKCREDLKRDEIDMLKQFAEMCYEYLQDINKNGGNPTGAVSSASGSRRRAKDIEMISDKVKHDIISGIVNGYITQTENGKRVKYGISRENINVLLDLAEEDGKSLLNAEMLRRLINQLEAEGKKFKFEKNSGWKKAGYKDPNED